jgi:hypothetical protein
MCSLWHTPRRRRLIEQRVCLAGGRAERVADYSPGGRLRDPKKHEPHEPSHEGRAQGKQVFLVGWCLLPPCRCRAPRRVLLVGGCQARWSGRRRSSGRGCPPAAGLPRSSSAARCCCIRVGARAQLARGRAAAAVTGGGWRSSFIPSDFARQLPDVRKHGARAGWCVPRRQQSSRNGKPTREPTGIKRACSRKASLRLHSRIQTSTTRRRTERAHTPLGPGARCP